MRPETPRGVKTETRTGTETSTRPETPRGLKPAARGGLGTQTGPVASHRAAPIATITAGGGTIRIVGVDRAALGLGVRIGMTLAEAKAIVPHLATYDDEPDADRDRLESLAVWANAFSPVVQIEGNDSLLVDVTGCERLFGGDRALLARVIEGLHEKGFFARGAIADTPGAARAIAHAHPRRAVVTERGQDAPDLVSLPVRSLGIEESVAAALNSVGVETIESLLHLPRSSLTSRFGDGLLARMDQVLGHLPEVLTPHMPTPVTVSRLDFGAPTDRLDALQEAVRRALAMFCTQLATKVVGVCQIFVTFSYTESSASSGTCTRHATFELNLSQPTRSEGHLKSLLMAMLGDVRLPAPANALTMWAKRVEPLDDRQEELFVTDARDAEALGDLIDRLAMRLGGGAVVRPVTVSDHQPERAYRYEPLVGAERRRAVRTTDRSPRKFNRRNRAAGFSPRGATNVKCSAATQSIELSNAPGDARRGLSAECGDERKGSPCASDGLMTFGQSRELKPETQTRPEASRGLKPAVRVGDGLSSDPPRPVRLAHCPIEIAATALVSDGPPVSIRLGGISHAITRSVGPERIETGWWRGPHVQRDYYRIMTRSGLRLWLFRRRDTDKWFLHGWFD